MGTGVFPLFWFPPLCAGAGGAKTAVGVSVTGAGVWVGVAPVRAGDVIWVRAWVASGMSVGSGEPGLAGVAVGAAVGASYGVTVDAGAATRVGSLFRRNRLLSSRCRRRPGAGRQSQEDYQGR